MIPDLAASRTRAPELPDISSDRPRPASFGVHLGQGAGIIHAACGAAARRRRATGGQRNVLKAPTARRFPDRNLRDRVFPEEVRVFDVSSGASQSTRVSGLASGHPPPLPDVPRPWRSRSPAASRRRRTSSGSSPGVGSNTTTRSSRVRRPHSEAPRPPPCPTSHRRGVLPSGQLAGRREDSASVTRTQSSTTWLLSVFGT